MKNSYKSYSYSHKFIHLNCVRIVMAYAFFILINVCNAQIDTFEVDKYLVIDEDNWLRCGEVLKSAQKTDAIYKNYEGNIAPYCVRNPCYIRFLDCDNDVLEEGIYQSTGFTFEYGGRFTRYDTSGNIFLEGEYSGEQLKHGHWNYYNKQKEVVFTEVYEFGRLKTLLIHSYQYDNWLYPDFRRIQTLLNNKNLRIPKARKHLRKFRKANKMKDENNPDHFGSNIGFCNYPGL